ncbi:PsiF family protein [Steroidobacter cummioxidans]|uniref:PsiF family protein n=1 Tax=Steroidobacter cummioxidans TaxID=1803913 RepID=UPI000E311E3B|nr:PsiF family protein [Steroidobacter cummioxidans]
MQPLPLSTALAISILLGAVPGYAAQEQPTQQEMADCSAQAQAHNLIGDVHESFMKMCMDPRYKSASQHEMMTKCHASASEQGYKGDELKQFMNTCMKQ